MDTKQEIFMPKNSKRYLRSAEISKPNTLVFLNNDYKSHEINKNCKKTKIT